MCYLGNMLCHFLPSKGRQIEQLFKFQLLFSSKQQTPDWGSHISLEVNYLALSSGETLFQLTDLGVGILEVQFEQRVLVFCGLRTLHCCLLRRRR